MTSIHSLIHGVLDRWLAEPVVIALAEDVRNLKTYSKNGVHVRAT